MQRFSFLVLPCFVAVGALVACGSKKAAKTPIVVPARDAGASSVDAFATSPPPSGLPPMAPMPAPGVAGSKKAKIKTDGALEACGGQREPHAKDPAALVKSVGESCQAPSKMKPLGPPLRGTQADKDAHQENKFHAEANHCYRVYFAADDGVKDLAVVLRDSNGDVIAESPGPAAPQDGAMCFSAADDVSVLVAIGNGKGAWVAQVWGD